MTDLREDTRAIQKRLGSTPFPDDLQGIADDANVIIARQAFMIEQLKKGIIATLPDMVVPLVWVDHPFNGEPVISMAKSPFGTYFICDDTDDFTGLYCKFISHKDATWYGTVTASTVLICDHWHGDDHAPLQHQADTHHVATILAAFGVQGETAS